MQFMGNLLLIIISFTAGFLLSKLKHFPKNSHKGINAFIFYISLPALSLRYIPEIDYNIEIIFPVIMPWLVFIFGAVLFITIGKILNWSKQLIGCLVLCCGLGNTSFVGFPLLELFYGKESIRYGILADQPGSFMVMSTIGIFAAVYFSNGKANWKQIGIKIFKFPPFIAFVIALFLSFVEMPTLVNFTLEKLGATLSPLALFSIGTQLKWKSEFLELKPIGIGLLYKLGLAPLVIYLLYLPYTDSSGLVFKVSIMEAAMAPMITGILLAIEYKLKPNLASMFAAIGIPLSLLTTWIWYLLMN